MTSQKSQNSNMLLAFLTLLGVIVLVAVVGFFMLRKGPEIIQGQAEVTVKVSSDQPTNPAGAAFFLTFFLFFLSSFAAFASALRLSMTCSGAWAMT